MPLPAQPVPAIVPALSWRDCVAKSTEEGKPGLSVHEHCRHVAEVAKALLEQLHPAVARLLGASPVSVTAAHDIGKVSPGFQKKYFNEHVRRFEPMLASWGIANFETLHARIGEATIAAYLDAPSGGSKLAAVVGAHHGSRQEVDQLREGDQTLGGSRWADERRALTERLVAEYGPLSEWPEPDLDVLAGLVSVADWIGSDQEHFPPSGLPDGADVAGHARQAVADCGWRPVHILPGLTFRDVFGFDSHPMQRDFVAAVDSPGLYVLEAPMGQGKTEAALYAAYKLMVAGHNTGLYFGLPTRLTSDRIHRRVRPFIEGIAGGDHAVRLAHGHAWLRAFEHGGEQLAPGGEWFRPRKRALLLPFAVGTIDQALLGVLKVRHHFVRCFGLAGKVVILDEVHSYDVYTGTLLDLLIQRLLEMGCSVIVLSATLTQERRRQLVAVPETPSGSDAYPLISKRTHGGVTLQASAPPAELSVTVALIPRSDRELAAIAVEKAQSRQCVVCIANTVAQAQRWYNEVKAAMPQDAFEVALLHSRFPGWRRAELEDLWMGRLGKDGQRPPGCVLVATQVVEQSVDIDADFMVSELAPTDMLLQRIGRLWRHPRPGRPAARAEVRVVAGDISAVTSLDGLLGELGKSNSLVYAPYVLWRSYQVWSQLHTLQLPGDVRGLLERTYAEVTEELPDFVQAARQKLERGKEKLRRLANAVRADVTGFCVMADDEQAATRYSDLPSMDVLLVLSIASKGRSARLGLCDGQRVEVDSDTKNPWVTAQLYRNVVSLPAYWLVRATTPQYLRKHLSGTPVLVIAEGGALLREGHHTGLRYDGERGVQRDTAGAATKRGGGRSASVNRDFEDGEGEDDEPDW